MDFRSQTKWCEAPMNIVFGAAQEPQSIDQMIASTERGVLVTRLWYIREIRSLRENSHGHDPRWHFLCGKWQNKARSFEHFRFTPKPDSHVVERGGPGYHLVRASGEESFDMVVPAMKVREFNFTEVTKF